MGKVSGVCVGRGMFGDAAFKKRCKNNVVQKNNVNVKLVFFIGVFLVLGLGLLAFQQIDFTGKIIFFMGDDYYPGEIILGKVDLILEEGEFMPGDTQVLVNNSGEISEFLLSDLVSRNLSEGDFYIKDTDISGSGLGYGISEYPAVSFVLNVYLDNEIGEEVEEVNERVEIGPEVITNEPEKVAEGVVEDEVILTGAVIGGSDLGYEVAGEVSYGEEFVYDLEEGKNVEIASSDEDVVLEIEDGRVIVTTEYTGILEEKIKIDLSKLNLSAKEGELKISLMYEGVEIISASETVKVRELAKKNDSEIDNEKNISDIVDISSAIENITTRQYKAVIGRPVKILKVVNVSKIRQASGDGNISIKLPKQARDIKILTGGEVQEALDDLENFEETVNKADKKDLIRGSIITGEVSLDIDLDNGFFTKLYKRLLKFSITGKVIEEIIANDSIIETADNKVVELENVINVEEVEEIAIEYYSDAPVATEEDIDNGKKIVVSAADELNYTEVLAYTLVPELSVNGQEGKIKIGDDRLRLFWSEEVIVNGSKFVRDKVEVDFDSHDLDGDGFVDYVEWIVPHLTSQSYELIYITKAERLDSDRSFVEDVYDYVKEQDDNYTYIGDGEYLRVTFEVELDDSKDITLYAKGNCENFILINDVEVPCEVYWKKVRIDEIGRELYG